MKHQSGRHFLQIPGPTNVPDRVLRAIDRATVDQRGPEFQEMSKEVLAGLKHVFKTKSPVVIFPASGTGAWEAALVNTLSPGDRVLMFETGHFATLWLNMAKRLGLDPVFVPGDWRHGVDPAQVEAKLAEDKGKQIKAVMAVHNETSTGVTTRIGEVRKAIDRAKHPALFMVDTISSLASIDYRHDEWGVDVTVAGSQKGLMLPPGLSFNAVSDKALAASKSAKLPRSYWNWEEMIAANKDGWFPYTPATNLLYGLRVALKMLLEEQGLENVFKRHARLAGACRKAIEAMTLKLFAQNAANYSSTLTAVAMPQGLDSDAFIDHTLKLVNLPLGKGLGKAKGKLFRIGHLGSFNELELLAVLGGVEMALKSFGVTLPLGAGLAAAETYFLETTNQRLPL